MRLELEVSEIRPHCPLPSRVCSARIIVEHGPFAGEDHDAYGLGTSIVPGLQDNERGIGWDGCEWAWVLGI